MYQCRLNSLSIYVCIYVCMILCLLNKTAYFLHSFCFIAAGVTISPLSVSPFLSSEGKEKKHYPLNSLPLSQTCMLPNRMDSQKMTSSHRREDCNQLREKRLQPTFKSYSQHCLSREGLKIALTLLGQGVREKHRVQQEYMRKRAQN